MSKTCGDLDGKPCEFLLEFVQSGWSCANGFTRLSEDACAPVLALLDARLELEDMRSLERIAVGRVDSLRAEAAKWKRAAERMETAALKWEHDPCCAANADPRAVSRVEAKWIRHGLGPNDDPAFCACDECKQKHTLKEVP